MSAPAIVSLLWPKNLRVLSAFVRRHPGTTVLSLQRLMPPEARASIRAAGGTVVCAEELLSGAEQQQLSGLLAAKQLALRAALRDPAWRKRWRRVQAAPERLGDLLCESAAAHLPSLLTLLAAVEKTAAQKPLRLIALNEDLTAMPRVLIGWARRRGIPTLHLSHGVELGEPYTVHARLNADVTAVFGARGCAGYTDIGLDTSSLRITGNPAWDDYPRLRQRRAEFRHQVATEHGLSPLLPIVVFGTIWAANLTAFSDEGIHGKTLRSFLLASRQLLQSGLALQLVIKDRPGAPPAAAERVRTLVAELGLPAGCVRYVQGEAAGWLLAADLLVSMQSNLSIEAMLAGVPAIDLLTEIGMWLGPCYAADSGVLEVEEPALADAMRRLLCDDGLRQRQLAAMARAAPLHNTGVDGKATERVVALMEEMIGAASVEPMAAQAWRHVAAQAP